MTNNCNWTSPFFMIYLHFHSITNGCNHLSFQQCCVGRGWGTGLKNSKMPSHCLCSWRQQQHDSDEMLHPLIQNWPVWLEKQPCFIHRKLSLLPAHFSWPLKSQFYLHQRSPRTSSVHAISAHKEDFSPFPHCCEKEHSLAAPLGSKASFYIRGGKCTEATTLHTGNNKALLLKSSPAHHGGRTWQRVLDVPIYHNLWIQCDFDVPIPITPFTLFCHLIATRKFIFFLSIIIPLNYPQEKKIMQYDFNVSFPATTNCKKFFIPAVRIERKIHLWMNNLEHFNTKLLFFISLSKWSFSMETTQHNSDPTSCDCCKIQTIISKQLINQSIIAQGIQLECHCDCFRNCTRNININDTSRSHLYHSFCVHNWCLFAKWYFFHDHSQHFNSKTMA